MPKNEIPAPAAGASKEEWVAWLISQGRELDAHRLTSRGSYLTPEDCPDEDDEPDED